MAMTLPERAEILEASVPGTSLLEVGPRPGRQAGKRHTAVLPVARLTFDMLAVSVAMVVASRLKSAIPGKIPSGSSSHHLAVAALSLPVWALMLWRGRLYSGPHIAGRLDEFRRLVRAEVRTLSVVVIGTFLLRTYVSRSWLVITASLAIALLVAERALVRRGIVRLRRTGRLLNKVLVVGGNVEALGLCALLGRDPSLGYVPVGFVDNEANLGARLLGGYPVLGRVSETLDVARAAGATAVIIATTSVDHETTNHLIRQLSTTGFQVELSSSLCDIAPTRLQVRPLGRFPLVFVDPVKRDGWEMRAKRVFDFIVAASVGIVAAPLLALAGMAIKVTSRGPVHFRQKRVGKDGELFEVLKFRTMVVGAEAMMDNLRLQNQADGPLFKVKGDPRITRVGRVLRALSIDEFPQLWNVLRGDMSLVGPRPALPKEVHLWSPELHGRLAVRPGMTGMWQVSGGGRWTSFDEYARLDLYYVDNWSIWTDLAILAKTVPAVLFGHGQA
jgi:exopolysaccharide biosynthesis polyprenyl glycosylphosphotransferase